MWQGASVTGDSSLAKGKSSPTHVESRSCRQSRDFQTRRHKDAKRLCDLQKSIVKCHVGVERVQGEIGLSRLVAHSMVMMVVVVHPISRPARGHMRHRVEGRHDSKHTELRPSSTGPHLLQFAEAIRRISNIVRIKRRGKLGKMCATRCGERCRQSR